MTDSRNQPELETLDYRAPTTEKLGSDSYKSHHFEKPASAPPATLGFNSHVTKPESRVNKAEDASQPVCKTCKGFEDKYCVQTGMMISCPDCKPKPSLKIIEEPGQPPERLDSICQQCGEKYSGDGFFCSLSCYKEGFTKSHNIEQPNLKIIEEIEGLMSQVNEKLDALVITDKELGDSTRKWRKGQALEETDLFQKTTLFELRKSFE